VTGPIADGRTIVEASAGTGKTYAIAADVTQLVAHEGVPLGEILVVTFTKAATAELKSRVRNRMVETLRVLEGQVAAEDPDGHLQFLLDLDDDARAEAIDRLRYALTHFDVAQIFTIHGFAQRLMAYLGFRSRLSPDLEHVAIDEQLVAQVASDLVVGRFAHNTNAEDVVGAGTVSELGLAVIKTPDARIVPDADDVTGIARTRIEMAHEMKRVVDDWVRRSGQVTFDDGLVEARDALADEEIGEAARTLLQRRYTIAFVDEAQDTDPIQWQIIRSVFGDSRLVVIGDPKQSIYSFRGADIESYLAAADGADDVRTLDVNWRSDGPLLQALDAMFGGVTFGDPRIQYRKVQPAPGHEGARIHGLGAPLLIRQFSEDIDIPRRKDGYFRIGDARDAVAADVASQIVELLTSGVTIDDSDSLPSVARPVGPADIAVLCRTGRQVDSVRAELSKRNVPSVAAKHGDVFETEAAEQWRRFLKAVERPDRVDLVRMAATTILVGYSPDVVAGFDEADVLELQHRIMTWQAILNTDGVPALVAELNRSTGLAVRALAGADGERVITDITHVAEELHTLGRSGAAGSLVARLEAAMIESAERTSAGTDDSDSRQRRLETDADAVQVQTIHSAKGLEYPVVFVPFAWDSSARTPTIPIFHDPDIVAVGGAPRPRLIDVSGKGSDSFDVHKDQAMREAVEEEGRLLYVALTRAKHRLVVWWLENAKPTALSKLTELVIPDDDRKPLLVAAEGSIETSELTSLPPVVRYEPEDRTAATLERARFDRPLDHQWRRASFSSLSTDHPLSGVAETSERPLRFDESSIEEDPSVPIASVTLPMADLPRGARFGTLVHEIFEEVPFDSPDLGAAVRRELDVAMGRSAWDLDTNSFVAGMVASMETSLGPDDGAPRLCDLDPARLLDEMNFELPVRSDNGVVTLSGIGELMLEHLPADDPYRAYGDHLVGLPPDGFRGYLTGSIDLMAEVTTPGGPQYVVVDYKSNTLRALTDLASPIDYGPGPLATAMISGNYVLQATLYQVALHRYLQWRLRGYDPAVHLGGSMYLFVRGMVGADTPVVDGERCGVARWKPPSELIMAISDLFIGPAA